MSAFTPFLDKLTPESYCALVYDLYAGEAFDLAQSEQIVLFNTLFASGEQDLRVYEMSELDEVLDGLTASEVLDYVASDFTTNADVFSLNQSTGIYESAYEIEELDSVSRFNPSDYKERLHDIAVADHATCPSFQDLRYYLDDVLGACIYECAVNFADMLIRDDEPIGTHEYTFDELAELINANVNKFALFIHNAD